MEEFQTSDPRTHLSTYDRKEQEVCLLTNVFGIACDTVPTSSVSF